MKKKIISVLSVIVFLALIACDNNFENEKLFSHYESLDFDNGLFNYNTIVSGNDAHSGTKFSRTNVGINFGIGYSYTLPDSLKGKPISININAFIRNGDLTNANDIIVSLTRKDSILFWTGCNAKEFLKKSADTLAIINARVEKLISHLQNFRVKMDIFNVL